MACPESPATIVIEIPDVIIQGSKILAGGQILVNGSPDPQAASGLKTLASATGIPSTIAAYDTVNLRVPTAALTGDIWGGRVAVEMSNLVTGMPVPNLALKTASQEALEEATNPLRALTSGSSLTPMTPLSVKAIEKAALTRLEKRFGPSPNWTDATLPALNPGVFKATREALIARSLLPSSFLNGVPLGLQEFLWRDWVLDSFVTPANGAALTWGDRAHKAAAAVTSRTLMAGVRGCGRGAVRHDSSRFRHGGHLGPSPFSSLHGSGQRRA